MLYDLVLSHVLFEPASDCRKTNKGWGCVEKMVEAKLKNNLQQLKEIAALIIYIIVVPANAITKNVTSKYKKFLT